MRDYFDNAYEGFCNSFRPLTDCMIEVAKIAFVYVTLPLWIVPYAIHRKIKERKENHA